MAPKPAESVAQPDTPKKTKQPAQASAKSQDKQQQGERPQREKLGDALGKRASPKKAEVATQEPATTEAKTDASERYETWG